MEDQVPTLPWYPWPGQGWPASLAQELQFIASLERHVDSDELPDPSSVGRSSFTAVLNALRGGASLEDMFSVAPHLSAPNLLVAYRYISDRLGEASAAYEVLATAAAEEHSTTDLHRLVSANIIEVGYVLPRVSERLLTHLTAEPAADGTPHESLRITLVGLIRRVQEASRLARETESRLYSSGPLPYRHPKGVAIGQQLYSPYQDSIYTDRYYLPDRVASIDPVRAKNLLSEIVRGFTDEDLS